MEPSLSTLAFPFDFALKRGVEEKFINDFGNAVAARVPFSGGNKRPNIAVRDFSSQFSNSPSRLPWLELALSSVSRQFRFKHNWWLEAGHGKSTKTKSS